MCAKCPEDMIRIDKLHTTTMTCHKVTDPTAEKAHSIVANLPRSYCQIQDQSERARAMLHPCTPLDSSGVGAQVVEVWCHVLAKHLVIITADTLIEGRERKVSALWR